jgi:hypothetical protein
LAAWKKVARPVELGCLGVLNLTMLDYTLPLRWEWQAKTSPDKPWATLVTKPERDVHVIFDASVTMEVGNRSPRFVPAISLA